VKNYAIKEIFNTLQGEGSRVGTRAVFVRFAGCNLWNGRAEDRDKGRGACARWCDSDFAEGEKLTLQQLLERMDAAWAPLGKQDDQQYRWCVITGGEPLLQVDRALLVALREAGWWLALETNGTVNPMDNEGFVADLFDHITLSPKKGTEDVLLLRRCTDLKVVLPGAVGDEAPWTDAELERLSQRVTHLYAYVQPQDTVQPHTVSKTFLTWGHTHEMDGTAYAAAMKRCLDFVMQHPWWSLSVQMHKYLELP
jgi:organic radical activating enzyme